MHMIIHKPSIDMFIGKSEVVILRFDSSIAHLVKQTIFHHTQRSKSLEDGSVEVLDVGIAVGLAYWILSFGNRVVVVKPEKLAKSVEKLARATANRY